MIKVCGCRRPFLAILSALIINFSLFLLLPARGSASLQRTSTNPETAILKLDKSNGDRSIHLTGLANGTLTGIELAVRRSDGRYYNASTAEWSAEPVWQKGTLMPMGSTRFSWDEKINLTSLDDTSVLVLARAVGRGDIVDPTPSGTRIRIDSVAPIVKKFDIAGSRWSAQPQVGLVIDVSGAKYMRFAESRKKLEKARRRPYSSSAVFRLSKGDGPKQIYGTFIDRSGNATTVALSGGPILLDTAPPVATRLSPAAEAKSVSINARIAVAFIEGGEIDPSTIRGGETSEATFYLTRDNVPTSASVTYDSRRKTAVLIPGTPLIQGKMYTAHLGPGVMDVAGNILEGEISWRFRAVEPTPPETHIDILSEETSSHGEVVIRGTATDPDGVIAVGVYIRDQNGRYWEAITGKWTDEPIADEAELVRKGSKHTGWRRRWPLPKSDGDRYVITAVAKDRFLAEDPTPAGFSLLVDNQVPRADRLILQNGALVTASDTIDVAAVVKGAVWMRLAENPGKLKQVPWKPAVPITRLKLSKKQGEKQVFGQWRDALGNTSSIGTGTGMAAIILDKAGPKVASTFPHDKAKDANVSVMITANFDEISIDESSVNTETFKLFDSTGSRVPAQVKFDKLSQSAALTPLEFLKYGLIYRAVLDGTISDRLGNTIGHSYSWEFKTIKASTHPPSSPQNLRVLATERGDRLTWRPPAKPDKGNDFDPPTQGGYNIYRRTGRSGSFELVNQVPVVDREYLDKDYERPGRRFYLVRAVDAGGGIGPASKVRVNDRIDMTFTIKSGKASMITLSNDLLRLAVPAQRRTIRLRIKTKKEIDGPPTPLPVFDFDSSPTVRLRNMTVFLPSDSSTTIVQEKKAGGWQPLTGVSYVYDSLSRALTVGPLVSNGEYAIVNKIDVTVPDPPAHTDVRLIDGKPAVSWSDGADKESGISAYRLFRNETTLASEAPVASAVITLPPRTNRFVDHSARSGRRYFYGVAAVNGSGLTGLPALFDPIEADQPSIEHRPRVAGVTNCRSCHIEIRINSTVKSVDCLLCHDGTGSRIIIADDEETGRSSLCRSCHALTKSDLNKVAKKKSRCGGCHSDKSSLAVKDNGHLSISGLASLKCTSCHSLHRPGNKKNKYLIDPANVRKTWSGSSSGFCLVCHGFKSPPKMTDDSNGFVPRDVVFTKMVWAPLFPRWTEKNWKRSSHSRSTECITCHEPHRSPNARLIAFRVESGKYVYYSKLTAAQALCYECHRPGGPRGAVDILTLARAPSTHEAKEGLSIHSDTETAIDLGLSKRHVNCGDCHNIHESRRLERLSFTNRVSGALRGVSGVEPNPIGAGAVSGYVEVYPAVYEYQICLKCHSSYVQLPPLGLTDYAVEFNPSNPSYHPVEARGKNRGIRAAAFVGGWNQTATMYCSDCHTNVAEKGTAKGPHGSKYKPLLAAPFGREVGGGRDNDLCYLCHNKKVYRSGAPGSRFSGSGGHKGHVAGKKLGCGDCHVSHGSSFSAHLIEVEPFDTSGTVSFTHDTTGGACVTLCHRRPAEAYKYKHAY